MPGKAFYVGVPDLQTGNLICSVLADYDLFQFENNIKPDYANAGGLEMLVPGEDDWESIDLDDPDDVRYAEEQIHSNSTT